jgi:hypothetical protein
MASARGRCAKRAACDRARCARQIPLLAITVASDGGRFLPHACMGIVCDSVGARRRDRRAGAGADGSGGGSAGGGKTT